MESHSSSFSERHNFSALDRGDPTGGVPFVTIVLPIRNEAAFIERGLQAVLAQDYPHERMEVIVADGMSDDGTREIVQRIIEERRQCLRSVSNPPRGPISIVLLDNPRRIVPTGLNAAILQARGDIILRVDGHCEIEWDYVSRCVEHLQKDGIDVVGGPLETVGKTAVARAIAVAMSSPFGVGNSAFRTVKNRTMLTDTVAFAAYSRAIVERAGLFDEELVRNQDDEYNYRLCKLGAKILLAHDVRSRYYSRGSFRSLWCQYFQYGYWKVRVMQKHLSQMRLRHFVPVIFVVVLVCGALLASLSTAIRSLWLALLIIYILANLNSSLLISRRTGWLQLPLLAFAFVILHLSYGSGFFVGLAKFWNLWGLKPSGVPSSSTAAECIQNSPRQRKS